MKILFVLKERFYSKNTNSYGLINSSKHVAEYLEHIGHECKVVQVIDGNCIDAELYEFRPDVVIIEALWVTGSKLKELIEIPRYSNITWIVRVHSDIGFLSAETMALKYVNDYIELGKDNLHISMNNKRFNDNASQAMDYEFVYLPNIISIRHGQHNGVDIMKDHIDVGCFGSLRILKNQCYQALCAMEMADRLGKVLRFHITVDVGMSESNNRYPVLMNLEQLFKNSRHELVKHEWLSNLEFQELIESMDIGMQLSYTESFNIVSADFVVRDVPIVVSDAISWLPWLLKTSTTDYEKSVRKLILIYRLRKFKFLRNWMKKNLLKYNDLAKAEWRNFLAY